MMKQVILISGKARSGKDTLADFMYDQIKLIGLSVEKYKISGLMKKWARQDFDKVAHKLKTIATSIENLSEVMFDLKDHVHESCLSRIKELTRELILPDDYEVKTDLSRILLQTYGTDIFQNRVDPDFWSKKAYEEISSLKSEYVIVTDIRWPSNLEIIGQIPNCVSIRIDRNTITNGKEHESETALNEWTSWDYVVQNDSTIEELEKSAAVILNDLIIKDILGRELVHHIVWERE